MGIGTSDGQYYEDAFEMHAELKPGIEPNPEEVFHNTMKEAYSPEYPAPKSLKNTLIGTDRHVTWPEKFVRDMWDAITLPGDVYAGKASPDDIGRALSLAGAVTFGAMPLKSVVAPAQTVAKEAAKEVVPEVIGSAASTAPAGSLERLGLQTYDRELGRNVNTGEFGRVPAEMSRGRGGPIYSERMTPERIAEIREEMRMEPPRGWGEIEADDVHRAFTRSGREGEYIEASSRPTTETAKQTAGQKLSDFKEIGQSWSGNRRFEFESEGNVGTIAVSKQDDGKRIHVEWIGRGANELEGKEVRPWAVGTSAIRNLLRKLSEAYPEAETISGFRVSGARSYRGVIGDSEMKLPKKKAQ